MRPHWLLLFFHMVCAGLLGQAAKPPAPSSPVAAQQQAAKPSPPGPALPTLSIGEPELPLPAEIKLQLRDLQYQVDQLEIASQKALVQVEQNKAKQTEMIEREREIATDYMLKNHISLDMYELRADELAFRKRKTTK